MNNELYLKTAFCCMACDGFIAKEEIQLIKDYVNNSSLFEGLNVEKLLNEYICSINAIKISFLNLYLQELKEEVFTQDQELQIMKIAIEMIEIDKKVLYSEIKFFKRIRSCLKVSDDIIEKEFPDKEDFFLPDIEQNDYELIMDNEFATIKLDIE